jgi:hypothetical protein
MKKLLIGCLLIICALSTVAQKATMTWGEEFKLHKGGSDLSVIYSDNTGVYLKETHIVQRFSFFNSTGESATLVKLDRNLTELYTNDFNRELKGKDFEQFFVLKDKLFLLARDYDRKTHLLTLYGAGVDKETGLLLGDWQTITSWEKEDKNDDIAFKVNYNADSTKMVLVSSVQGNGKNTYEARQFDVNFKQTDKPIVISNEFDPKTFQLEDVLYTSIGNIVLVGRIYEYEDGRKKKDKFLDFSNYNIRIYDNQGKQVKEVNTAVNGKWMVSTKVVQEEDKDLVLAAFFSNQKKGKTIDGLLVQRINPATGEVVSTSQKDINTSLISTAETDSSSDADDKQAEKAKQKLQDIQDAQEGFSRDMRFRKIYYTPDNGIIILAEKYFQYTYSTSQYINGQWETDYYTSFESSDMMMSKIDAAGKIAWLNILPKDQQETLSTGSDFNGGFGLGAYYFQPLNMMGMPFYSGFSSIQTNNYINLIFNDNPKNAAVLQLGQKLKSATNFRKSHCYMVSLDEITGKYNRQEIFSNEDIPTAMPRLGSVAGQAMYLVGKQDPIIGKTKIAVGLLSIK